MEPRTQGLFKEEKAAEEAIYALNINESERTSLLGIVNIQKEKNVRYSEYLRELKVITTKYEGLYVPLYNERRHITGKLPGFWLRVLNNSPLVSSCVYAQDEALLGHLLEIRCIKEPATENFLIEFEFSHNEYIENRVLSKKYIMASADAMERAQGTQIIWKKKNLTQKKKHNKGKGTRAVDCPSFFNFFRDVTMPGSHELDIMDTGYQNNLSDAFEEDYDLASEIRDEVVPNAMLCYMNVVKEEDDSEDNEQPREIRTNASGSEPSNCNNQ